ncbi:MAG: GMC family oxidoreductase N-terminal domain-containing protein [Rhodobacteraceae bacterium]|nr:GMC family oxidoreductase N-terminal domain-containing protein [Paracoccaceae bacterium]
MSRAYDFVIVGGGSAGCVLAARLSEIADATVCLIEAGGTDWHPFFHIPAGFAKMTKGLGSWGWSTVPQRYLGGRVMKFTQARVIGGGSTINAQIYTRGNALDYDSWRQAGCQGWGYEDVLPYFRESEANDTYDDRYHGKDGPLGVSQPAAPLPICEAFFRSAGELGIHRNTDMAGAKQDGVGYYQLTQAKTRRSSTAQAFLRPARRRQNLSVMTGQEAQRLLVEKGRAIGVQLGSETVRATTEVIISSGAIGSPRLLMLSGIGPADHLTDLGVEVVAECPGVGSNLQDHIDLFTISECTGPHTYDASRSLVGAARAGLRYLLSRSGPAASSLFETGGFWYADPVARSPDIQFHLGLGSGIEAGVAKMQNAGVTLNSAYLRPRSRGTVRLASSNPAIPPLIDPNYWSDPLDRAMSIRGLRMAREIMAGAALKTFVRREVLPGPIMESDDALFAYAAAHAKTDHHPAGTCRMGVDHGAVVSPSLAFQGIERLRVADASIMPTLVSSNTNAPTIMIAEKAADMIKADYLS